MKILLRTDLAGDYEPINWTRNFNCIEAVMTDPEFFEILEANDAEVAGAEISDGELVVRISKKSPRFTY